MRDSGVRWLNDLVVDLVLVASLTNPLDVLNHPLWLQCANDRPAIVLFRVSTSSFELPVIRNVLLELWVLDGLNPHLLVGELGPSRVVDGDGLVLGEELLVACEDLLQEAQGSVLTLRHEFVLQVQWMRE